MVRAISIEASVGYEVLHVPKYQAANNGAFILGPRRAVLYPKKEPLVADHYEQVYRSLEARLYVNSRFCVRQQSRGLISTGQTTGRVMSCGATKGGSRPQAPAR